MARARRRDVRLRAAGAEAVDGEGDSSGVCSAIVGHGERVFLRLFIIIYAAHGDRRRAMTEIADGYNQPTTDHL